MEQQNPLPLTNDAASNGKYRKWKGRPDHEQMMLEVADVFGRKSDFTVPDLQAWFRDSVTGRQPSESFICDLLQEMVAEKLVEKLDRCRARFRLYRIVKSDAVTAGQVVAAAQNRTAAFVRTPEQIEQDLCLLEAMGIDTKDARVRQAQLKRALDTKAALEK